MKRLFSWHGRDNTDVYAISLYKMCGLMIFGSVGSYLIVRAQWGESLFEIWSWICSLVTLAAFLLSSTRRLRDIGRGTAFLAMFAVPVVGLLLFGYLLFAKSVPSRSVSEFME